MSTYSGRRGPNVSQYLAQLNTIPTEEAAEASFALEDPLALFTNTHFYDFDSGQTADFQPSDKTESAVDGQGSSTSEDIAGDITGFDFSTHFSFPEFESYQAPTITSFSDNVTSLQALQPGPPAVYAVAVPQQQQPNYVPPAPRIGDKRKADSPIGSNRSLSFEEASRLAAEEDKRRRNTAASARFRIKKKQREQALEKSAKEMTEKMTMLEGRIQQLETENKWLKNLIMEKNDSNEDLATMWKEFSSKQAAASLQKSEVTTTTRSLDSELEVAESPTD